MIKLNEERQYDSFDFPSLESALQVLTKVGHCQKVKRPKAILRFSSWACKTDINLEALIIYFLIAVMSQAVHRSTIQFWTVRVLSQYISIKIPFHKQSENPWVCY